MPRRKLPPISQEELVSTLLMLQGAVPFPKNLEVLAKQRLERERHEKFSQVKARLERNARRKAWGQSPRRLAVLAKARAARAAYRAERRAAKAEAKKKRREALKANPTLAWRHPRRAGWSPSDDYARGSRRKNRSPDSSVQAGANASTSGSDDPPHDSSSRTAPADGS